jgi:D-glycero-alpha-D-manno-heptose-7-phosphate kinase
MRTVIVNPLRVSPHYLYEFEASLVVCFTGKSRASDVIIADQVKAVMHHDATTLEAMHLLKADAIEMKQKLLGGDIRGVAEILNRSWQAKRRTSGSVSNSAAEQVFGLGLKNGPKRVLGRARVSCGASRLRSRRRSPP